MSIKDFSSELKFICENRFIDQKTRKIFKNKIDLFNNNCLPDFEKKII